MNIATRFVITGRAILLSLLVSSAVAGEGPPASIDPRGGEVPLGTQGGWDAYLVIDNDGVGVWRVDSAQVFPQYGSPEIVALDDLGRCLVLVSYSGRWTPLETVHDGKWLGGFAHGDIDPRIDGAETYVGSQKGNIYQVVGYDHGALDNRLIAHLTGREIHTIVGGDIDQSSDGTELIVFTRPGGLYRLRPTGEDGTWKTEHLQDLPGRVRDAVVLPAQAGDARGIATVSRTGRLELLQLTSEGPVWSTLYEGPMGKGRIALGESRAGSPVVLYTTHDDGRVLRHEQQSATRWETRTIYVGPQGPRGLATGRFDADPDVETVALFGYSGKVELLSRDGQDWSAETIFLDKDKGHWLAAAELDGRNGTRELLASGYGGRVVMLTRPPGYGLSEPTTPRE